MVIVDARSDFEKLKSKVERLYELMESLAISLSRLTDDLGELKNKLVETETVLDTRIDRVSSKVDDEVNYAVTNMERRISEVDEKIDRGD
jgi:predicted RNase H-like nuclease (RuvC/YqgF family)